MSNDRTREQEYEVTVKADCEASFSVLARSKSEAREKARRLEVEEGFEGWHRPRRVRVVNCSDGYDLD